MVDKRFERLAVYFKNVRLQRGMSQLELARQLGFQSAQIVSNWERGLCAPPMNAMVKMVSMFSLAQNEVMDMILEENKKLLEMQFSGEAKKRSKVK